MALLMMTHPLAAEDLLIDGVPIPGDAEVANSTAADPVEQRQWAGIWVGAWGGMLKHVLLVESVSGDGTARVVYATGANPWWGIKPAWSRHEATFSGHRLTISTDHFSATYERDDQGGLTATYQRGNTVSHTTMTRSDMATLAAPGAAIAWTRGTSELLPTTLVEDGKPARLEVVLFRPKGAGPFPLAVFNHGSTGRGTNPALFQETLFDVGLADFLNNRGWIVAFPQRRGRGKSDGRYDEGFAADRAEGYTCDPDVSLAGAERGLADIAAAIAALRQDQDVAPQPILIGGQSRGGILAMAYAGMHPDQISGVINFVGGWLGTGCDFARQVNGALFERGARFALPTLWLYGENDPFYDIQHSRSNFSRFQAAGGQGGFMTFDVPGGYGHGLLSAPALWKEAVAEYLNALPNGMASQ